jgi:hypothetical protein
VVESFVSDRDLKFDSFVNVLGQLPKVLNWIILRRVRDVEDCENAIICYEFGDQLAVMHCTIV